PICRTVFVCGEGGCGRGLFPFPLQEIHIPGYCKEEEFSLKSIIMRTLNGRYHTRRAVLYAPPAHSKTERRICQRILAQHGYTVTVLENVRLAGAPKYEGDLSSWDLLICLSSRKSDGSSCFQIDDFHHLKLFQKRRRLHNLPGQPVAGLCHPHRVLPHM
uniref:Uncharacterized protein n=1 Tax=Nothoprocta perdicaria TaxID=30464 RepID=A0A8C6YWS7_NOTPE